MLPFLFLCLSLASCRSAQTRNADLVRDRGEKLKPRAVYAPTWCRLDARLTGPATARYRQIFPADVEALTASGLPFTWKSSGHACEVMALDRSPLAINYQGFLDVALCVLAQTHLVNSPFTELNPVAIETRDKMTFLRTGEDAELGIFLDPNKFRVETRTKSRGTLTVDYEDQQGTWLPSRMAQRLDKMQIVIDQLEFEPPRGADVRHLRSFVINVGEDKVRPHSDVTVSECRSY